VMVSVSAGDAGPITTGIVYCAVILECMKLFDLRRAREWTQALSGWCDAQPDLVPYRGQCLVHRSQLAQASGDWSGAITAAESACAHLVDPPHPALGAAYYQEEELHRLIGAFDQAESEYREASRSGHDPMPGLALLQLARGDVPAAAASIRRALQERSEPTERPGLLAAAVEILTAADDAGAAGTAADELDAVAAGSPSRLLGAMASHATGSVLLAAGDHAAALVRLRAAAEAWRSLAMPYEAARASVLLARACTAMGDATTAAIELDHARDTFTLLGAVPDLDRVASLAGLDGAGSADTELLSAREREVLAHVAGGETNRQIADALSISQHTVDRHLENIFAKLGVKNRAAATAWAYRHDVL
jgi:DNA-binding CsgD family transcriptional regulator